ncbi:MAG: M28 family peptidase [Planctomycetes bacterium]|nr:M28 family peptidase [Planctomycetota bacterium]
MLLTRSSCGPILSALLSLVAPAVAQEAKLPPLPVDRAAGALGIRPERVREFLTTLASPEFEGRGTGQEGFRKAAEYVRAHFEKLGLEGGAPDGSFFQAVPWTQSVARPKAPGLAVRRGETILWSLDVEQGLRGYASTPSGVDLPLALVVTSDPEGGDLEQLELKDHAVIVVLVRTGEPESDARRRARAGLAARSRIARAAQRAGGRFLALADDAAWATAGTFEPVSRPGREASGPAGVARGNQPATGVLRTEHGAALLAALGDATPLAELVLPRKIALDGVFAHLAIEVEESQAPAWNVLAILRGSDETRKDEFVGVGCHLDHLGKRGGIVHPGADDDGSGSAGLMAIAEAFAKNPTRPARSILFMAFCGEELGLIGSGYFARNPTIPLESMVAELQIDMIGRNEEGERGEEEASDNLDCLHLIGSQKLSDDLHQSCLRLNERAGFALEWDEEDVFYRSDHWNFARQGVPIAFFFTGFHPQYHQPTDTVDLIDFGKLARVSTYVYDLAYELAQQEQRPLVDAVKWQELSGKSREAPAAPVRN